MKTFLKLIMFALMPLAFIACDDDNTTIEKPLDISYANIAGTWQLTEWNGETMIDGRYFYITLIRRIDDDGWRHYDIYQNINSSQTRHITGWYELTANDKLGAIINGAYDHGSGFWNSHYAISALEKDSMTWEVAVRDRDNTSWILETPSDVSVYTRVESVPEDIVDGTRAE